MLVALVFASSMGIGAQDSAPSTSRECEVLRAVLIANWPLEPPGTNSLFYLDPQTRERPIFLEGDHAAGDEITERVVDAQFVTHVFSSLDIEVAAGLVPYFAERPSREISCTFEGLRVTPASSSLLDSLHRQDALQYPRISLSQPVFSRDGRFAIGGYAWSFVPYAWAQGDCLLERVEGDWQIVECMRFP